MIKRASIYRADAVLLFGILLVVALYFGQPFFVPLFFAIILSMLLLPVSQKLESWGLGRISATLLSMLLLLLFMAGFCGVIYVQAARLAQDWPQIQPRLLKLLNTVQEWVQQQVGVSPQQQIQAIKTQLEKQPSSSGQLLNTVLGGLGGLLTSVVLVLLYVFFLMWKWEKYPAFILKLFAVEHHQTVRAALSKMANVSAQYLMGRLISMVFLAVFYMIGLSIIGLKNALLMSWIAVIPTLIPYVGAFVGATFPLAMALVSGSSDLVLPTAAILVVAQVIDNNIIEPLVMGAELNLSPLFTIIAIILGELLWGLPGMILFEPLFAMIKIVCDHVPALKPYGFLLENEVKEPQWIRKVRQTFGRNGH
ncbi:AI-2E family transporter [Larkinella insperata]|uniref:AI-2E family transporter n=1 Tax=Larkinella insperata TaxID=332158 RepID=A0ABW3Q2V7_9BACT|nr:AI-2E family transporter [Larkinella insperata]